MTSKTRLAPAQVPDGAGAPPPESADISALPGAFDEEIAVIFREMREATKLTKPDLAHQLTTSTRVIDALEEGALLALPAWPETSRVILAYADMLGLNGQPILRRIQRQLEARWVQRPQPRADKPAPEPAAPTMRADRGAAFEATRKARDGSGRASRPRARVLRWALACVITAAGLGTVLYAAQRPEALLSVTDSMPAPIAGMARAALRGDAGGAAQADPRSRKEDRLPVRGETHPASR